MRSDERLVLMPVLAPGSHVHPRVGGCFAEVAATLSTHQWTDHPTSIPPALSQVARRVNDLSSPEARTGLAPLIPWAVCRPHPSADLTRDTAVITAVSGAASSEIPVDPLLGLRVVPLLDHWPDWLREPWNRRLDELGSHDLADGEGQPHPPARRRRLTVGPPFTDTSIDPARAEPADAAG